MKSGGTGPSTTRCERPWSAALVAAILAAGLTGGCALGGASKSASEAKASPDSAAVLRQDVDRVRADLTELRTRIETLQRGSTEHADRVAVETRAEFDAVRKAMEASSRHEVQRQVEVLDAQSRRIDLLEKRLTDLSQSLRRVELSLTSVESQLGRVLDRSSSPPPPLRPGAATRSPSTPSASAASPPPASSPRAADEGQSTVAAGAGLTPPAMLGPARSVKSPEPP